MDSDSVSRRVCFFFPLALAALLCFSRAAAQGIQLRFDATPVQSVQGQAIVNQQQGGENSDKKKEEAKNENGENKDTKDGDKKDGGIFPSASSASS